MDRTAFTQRGSACGFGGIDGCGVHGAADWRDTPRKKSSFDEIEVKRINLIDPDGTLRLVISDKADFPGLIVKGKEYPHNRQTAGILFFNHEGTENGGLIFGSSKDKDGKVQRWGHLSLEQYMGDQVAVLNAEEEDGQRQA